MKQTMKQLKIISAFILAAAMLALCGCSEKNGEKGGATPSDQSASGQTSMDSIKELYTEEELKSAVITIGTHTVTLEEYIEFFDEIYNSFSDSYGVDIASDEETLKEYLNLITESMTEEKMVLYQADKLGLTDFTDEQRAEIQANYDAAIDEMYDYYTEYAESEAGDDATAEEIDELVEKYILEEAEYYCGEGTTADEYKEYLREQEEEQYIQELLFDEITAKTVVDDDETEEWYKDALEDDREYFKKKPEIYKEECDSFESTGYISDGVTAVAPLYVPRGYSRVYVITIASEGELSDKYNENEERMEELKAEYGDAALKLALDGYDEDLEKIIKDIQEEYKELKEENMEELEELHKSAKKKIEKAYDALESGKDFTDVMYEYTNDSNFKEGGVFAEKGRLISTLYSSTNDWSDETKAVFKGLEAGEYSEAYLDANGYHILFYIGDEESGARSFEDAKAEIREYLNVEAKQTAYDSQLDEWCKDESLIKKNNELIEKLLVLAK